MKIAIIGAGMAGSACGAALAAQGNTVTLLDKGRGPGGRMATRRIETSAGEAAFDHGAQYFTARDPGFLATMRDLERAGKAARWPLAGLDAWVGVPGMNAVIRAMTEGLDVRFGELVTGLEKQGGHWMIRSTSGVLGPFDAVILAIPAEQAATLLSLHDFELARIALRSRSQPCWTGMFAFAEPLDAPDAPIRDRDNISWAVRNSAKPGRHGPESWVVQAQPVWTEGRIELTPEEVCPQLLELLANALGLTLPEPLAATAHRWRFAMASGTGDTALWNPATGLGACGDWLVGPRVECAWLSGQAMAERLARTPAQARA